MSSSKLNVDPVPLMRKLCEMAGLPFDASNPRICRMVLVLDVDDIPRLYTQGFLNEENLATLPDTPLEVEELPYIDTTTMANEVWRTKIPKKQ